MMRGWGGGALLLFVGSFALATAVAACHPSVLAERLGYANTTLIWDC